jgi:SAM-dependent methyltransferase
MADKPGLIMGWTGQNARHAAEVFKQGGNAAARVYESIGSDFFLALAPGWLNLGLWEGPGTEGEAEDACRRLVRTLAAALPGDGVILDVGNGLGTQDPLIAETVRPRRLVAVNITEWQLAAGRAQLKEAAAAPVAGDATRLPLAAGTADGVISVEAAFHFRSRKAFFDECYRVLRPGGVLSMSDISTQRWPFSPAELFAGLTQLRVFGLRRSMAMTAGQIAAAARAAGLAEVEVTACGDRVFAPAFRLTAERLASAMAAPAGQRAAARLLLWQAELLWRHRIIDYLLIRAVRPSLRRTGELASPCWPVGREGVKHAVHE